MPTLTHYDIGTGRIISIISASGPSFEANKVGSWVEGEGSLTEDYVLGGEITPRPQMQASLSQHVITGLPTPCQLHIGNQSYECSDDTVELFFDQPGTYQIRIEAWPYLDKEFVIENPAL